MNNDAINLPDDELAMIVELLELADACPGSVLPGQYLALAERVQKALVARSKEDAMLGLLDRYERATALLDAVEVDCTGEGGSINGSRFSDADVDGPNRVLAWDRLRNQLKAEPPFVPGVRERIERLEVRVRSLTLEQRASLSRGVVDPGIYEAAIERLEKQISDGHAALDRLHVTPHPDFATRLQLCFSPVELATFHDLPFGNPSGMAALAYALANWLRTLGPVVLTATCLRSMALAAQTSAWLFSTWAVESPLATASDRSCGDRCRVGGPDDEALRLVMLTRNFNDQPLSDGQHLAAFGRLDSGKPLVLALSGQPSGVIRERAECRLIRDLK